MGYMLNLPKKAAVGAATLVAVLGAGGTAWAVESAATTTSGQVPASAVTGSTSATTTPATPGAKSGKAGGRVGGLLARADHATVEIKAKSGWETVEWDRGNVTASSATSITLQRPDGQSVTEAITSTTKYRGTGSIAVVGQPAQVISLNGSALRVAQGGGAAGSPAPAGAGASA